jgi:hypothetical protein
MNVYRSIRLFDRLVYFSFSFFFFFLFYRIESLSDHLATAAFNIQRRRRRSSGSCIDINMLLCFDIHHLNRAPTTIYSLLNIDRLIVELR